MVRASCTLAVEGTDHWARVSEIGLSEEWEECLAWPAWEVWEVGASDVLHLPQDSPF